MASKQRGKGIISSKSSNKHFNDEHTRSGIRTNMSGDLKTGVHQQARCEAKQHGASSDVNERGTTATVRQAGGSVRRQGVTQKDSDTQHVDALLAACRDGNVAEVKCVLDLEQDVNCRGERRMTPVMEAARCGHRDVVELLLSRGADVSLVDKEGDNTVHLACCGGDVGTVELKLSQDALDVNCREVGSWTAVMRAALGGHRDVAELLLSRGADVSLVDMDGNNILHWACIGGNVGLVELILSLNVVDINTRNNYRETAADWARVYGHNQPVELLESRGAQ